jgi:hypothetical protein
VSGSGTTSPQLTEYWDIRSVLLAGYFFGYPLAVVPPILIDHLLTTHAVFDPRNYAHSILCVPIYLVFLTLVLVVFKLGANVITLYVSICMFAIAIAVSLPIFRPEFPHGNLVAVGTVASLLFAFTTFVWSVGDGICRDAKSTAGASDASLGYLKELLSFVRQASFAGIGLFSGLLYGAFNVEFGYINSIASDESDKFLLQINAATQIAFYAIFAAVGPVRYFFLMSLRVLSDFKRIATKSDEAAAVK